MSHLRKQFEQETGKTADNFTGLGDYCGAIADSNIDHEYIKWLETKVEKFSIDNKSMPQLPDIKEAKQYLDDKFAKMKSIGYYEVVDIVYEFIAGNNGS